MGWPYAITSGVLHRWLVGVRAAIPSWNGRPSSLASLPLPIRRREDRPSYDVVTASCPELAKACAEMIERLDGASVRLTGSEPIQVSYRRAASGTDVRQRHVSSRLSR